MECTDKFGVWGTRIGGGDVGEDLFRIPVKERA